MDLDVLDQLQNQIHPDSAPQQGANEPVPIHEEAPEDNPVEAPPAEEPQPKPRGLDITSEELFPALPSAPSGKSPLGNWVNKAVNGHARAGSSSSGGSSRSPASSGGIVRPRKITERFEIPAHLQANLQNEKGKPITAAYVCKQIMSRLGTSIDLSTNARTGTLTVLINGTPDAVKQTKREVISALTLQVKETISIPVSVRPHLVGKAGVNIKALMTRTLTKIDMPRNPEEDRETPVTDDLLDNEPEQEVVIIGDYEGVEEAKKAVESLVAQRTSKRTLRMNIERSYFPFIAGPNGSQVQLLQLETNTRIHIPPAVPTSGDEGASEIVIVGERSAVLAAEERIKAIYEDVKRTTRTLQIPVKKRQHRFIVGPKGATLQEILERTGCHVELPSPNDPSEVVTVRGPDNMLSTALQLVIEKSNSTVIDEIDIVRTIATSTDPELFLRYVYTKERNQLKSIEATHNATILQQTSSEGTPLFEIQAKTQADADAARSALHKLVKEWGNDLCFGVVEIPSGLHKYVIGKGGQNITKVKAKSEWAGRLVDVVVPPENDESDEVIIVVKRVPAGKGDLTTSDKEALALVEKVKEELESQATALADLVTQTINVDPKYHGRLIGSGGTALKELLEPYGNAVSVKFPKGEKIEDKDHSSAIVVRGPKKDVAEVIDKIMKQVAEWRHVELISNFSEVLKVPKGMGKRLVGKGREIKWMVTAVRERIALGSIHKSKISEKELAAPNLNLRAEVDPGTAEDTVTLYGPKSIVELARAVVAERAQKLADTVSEEIDLFATISSSARKMLEEIGGDIRRRVLRRIIGKEGRGVKRLSEKHGVEVRFADRRRSARPEDEEEEGDRDAVETDEIADGTVVIKGSKGDVGPAREEIIELVEHEVMHSFSISFNIPKYSLPHIVGRAGSKLQPLKDEFGVRIDLNDLEDDPENVECVLEGTADGCAQAKEKLMEVVVDMVNTESADIKIPSFLHKYIIGPGGSRIRMLVDQLGGQDKVKIQFPRASADLVNAQDIVSVKAHVKIIPEIGKQLVRLANEALAGENGADVGFELLVGDEANVIEQSVDVPKADISRVAGKTGEGLVDVMTKYGVTVWPQEGENGDECVIFRIVGRKEKEANVQSARDELHARIRVSQTVLIPPSVLEKLRSTSGAEHDMHTSALQDVAKRVKQDCGIFPELAGGAAKGTEGSCFLLRGDQRTVERASKTCSKLLEELTKFTHTYRFQIEQDYRPHLIGRQGFTINRLRSESGAEIDIMRTSQKGGKDTVVIRGTDEETVQKARNMIEALLKDQEARLQRDRERQENERERERQREQRKAEARIDDEVLAAPESGSSSPKSVPGWSGRAQAHHVSRNRKKRAGDVATPSPPPLSRESSTGNYLAFVEGGPSKKADSEWKEVPGKRASKAVKKTDKKKTEEPNEPEKAVEVPANEASGNAVNKKKKKKSAKASEESSAVPTPEQVPKPTRPASPIKAVPAEASLASAKTEPQATSSASAKAPSAKVEPKAAPQPSPARPVSPTKDSKSTAAKPTAPQSEATARPPSPAKETSPAVYEEFEPTLAEDEWKTVNSVKKYKQAKLAAVAVATQSGSGGFGSVPTMPGEEEAAKKKKKNKKKKKKTGNDGAVMPGDEE